MSSSKSNRKNIMKSIRGPERTLEGSLESMPINSRAKGKAGELELSRVLREHGYDTPVIMHRKNREPWKVTMLLDDWIELYREWAAGKELEDGEKENTE